MQVRSLGYRSDLIFIRFGGEIIDRGSYLVARTPRQPDFYWGNWLLFPDPPARGDLERWNDLFEREFAAPIAARHRAFGWDDPEGRTGESSAFLAAGYTAEDCIVQSATELRAPPHPRSDLELRDLSGDREWEEAYECQLACRDRSYSLATYEPFLCLELAQRRRMVEAGWGRWFGAFDSGRLVGNLGLFVHGDVARFQSVATHPSARRRGVCGTLVHFAGDWALTQGGARTLVLVADAHEEAQRVYRSVGFADTERQAGLLRRPQS